MVANNQGANDKESRTETTPREQELFHAYELISDTVAVVKVLRKVPVLEGDRIEVKELVAGYGSGFIYKAQDLAFVFTAQHVVNELKRNERVQISLRQKDGQWAIDDDPTLLFEDADRDIAAFLVSLSANNLNSVELPSPALNTRTFLKVGVRITYCGFPYISKGEFIPIFQQGMIAGIDYGRFKNGGVVYVIDGMVNPGNSGGPAFIGTGKAVIGIVSAYVEPMVSGPKLAVIDNGQVIDVLGRSAGLGLVVPINYAIEQLKGSIDKFVKEHNARKTNGQNLSVAKEVQTHIKEAIASGRLPQV